MKICQVLYRTLLIKLRKANTMKHININKEDNFESISKMENCFLSRIRDTKAIKEDFKINFKKTAIPITEEEYYNPADFKKFLITQIKSLEIIIDKTLSDKPIANYIKTYRHSKDISQDEIKSPDIISVIENPIRVDQLEKLENGYKKLLKGLHKKNKFLLISSRDLFHNLRNLYNSLTDEQLSDPSLSKALILSFISGYKSFFIELHDKGWVRSSIDKFAGFDACSKSRKTKRKQKVAYDKREQNKLKAIEEIMLDKENRKRLCSYKVETPKDAYQIIRNRLLLKKIIITVKSLMRTGAENYCKNKILEMIDKHYHHTRLYKIFQRSFEAT